jgi:GGDEF domain-containing protein
LLDASRTLAASIDLDQVLAGVARLAVDVVDVAYATVYEYRPHHDAIVFRASHTVQRHPLYLADDPLGTQYQLADCPGERRILEAAGAVQEHISDPDLLPDRRCILEAWGQKSCLSLPLSVAGKARGILRLTVTAAEREFTADELELVEAISEVAGAAIHNARLFRAQQEESERLLQLFEVSRRLSSARDQDAVVAALEEGASRLLVDSPAAGVWLCGEDGLLDAAGDHEEVAGELALRALAGPGVAEEVAPRCSRLAVPVVLKATAEGVLVVEWEGYRRFSLAEREALQVLTNQAAAALENVRLYRRAEHEAIRDGLTGLYNHRHFQERLIQECRRARRYGTPLSLLILDLDEFKGFNDQYGHQIGDEALREVGQILFAVTRRGVDLAARYGGEEFAVILPHTRVAFTPEQGAGEGEGDLEAPPPAGAGALVVAERVREAVAAHAFPGHGGRRYARTTATVGVAELREGQEAAALIAAADAALYMGKRRGRDRVVVDGD